MSLKIGVIKGDGIGPEIVTEAMKVLDKAGEVYGFDCSYEQLLLGDGNVNVETVVEFFFLIAWFEDDSDSQQVKDFFERNMLGLHLVPNGID